MRRCHAGLFPGTRSRQTGHVSSRWKENACRRLKESLGNEGLRIIFPFVVYRCWRTDSSNCSITAGWKSAWPASREFLEERNDEGADELFFRLIGDRRVSPISVMFFWEFFFFVFKVALEILDYFRWCTVFFHIYIGQLILICYEIQRNIILSLFDF